jgi:hypothetical protein
MTDDRYQKIMSDLGMPHSRSLLQALQQVANEAAQEVRAALATPSVPSGEPAQIRADFEQRMAGTGASPSALSRLKSGEYLSPSIQQAWAAEKRKYASPQPAPAGWRLVHQWRTEYCSDWYDGHPDQDDGGGPYETRILYAAPAAPTQETPK